MSMTSEERLVKTQELRAEKEAIAHEIDQSRRHAQWHENKLLRLVRKLVSIDGEQMVLIHTELHARGEEKRG